MLRLLVYITLFKVSIISSLPGLLTSNANLQVMHNRVPPNREDFHQFINLLISHEACGDIPAAALQDLYNYLENILRSFVIKYCMKTEAEICELPTLFANQQVATGISTDMSTGISTIQPTIQFETIMQTTTPIIQEQTLKEEQIHIYIPPQKDRIPRRRSGDKMKQKHKQISKLMRPPPMMPIPSEPPPPMPIQVQPEPEPIHIHVRPKQPQMPLQIRPPKRPRPPPMPIQIRAEVAPIMPIPVQAEPVPMPIPKPPPMLQVRPTKPPRIHRPPSLMQARPPKRSKRPHRPKKPIPIRMNKPPRHHIPRQPIIRQEPERPRRRPHKHKHIAVAPRPAPGMPEAELCVIPESGSIEMNIPAAPQVYMETTMQPTTELVDYSTPLEEHSTSMIQTEHQNMGIDMSSYPTTEITETIETVSMPAQGVMITAEPTFETVEITQPAVTTTFITEPVQEQEITVITEQPTTAMTEASFENLSPDDIEKIWMTEYETENVATQPTIDKLEELYKEGVIYLKEHPDASLMDLQKELLHNPAEMVQYQEVFTMLDDLRAKPEELDSQFTLVNGDAEELKYKTAIAFLKLRQKGHPEKNRVIKEMLEHRAREIKEAEKMLQDKLMVLNEEYHKVNSAYLSVQKEEAETKDKVVVAVMKVPLTPENGQSINNEMENVLNQFKFELEKDHHIMDEHSVTVMQDNYSLMPDQKSRIIQAATYAIQSLEQSMTSIEFDIKRTADIFFQVFEQLPAGYLDSDQEIFGLNPFQDTNTADNGINPTISLTAIRAKVFDVMQRLERGEIKLNREKFLSYLIKILNMLIEKVKITPNKLLDNAQVSVFAAESSGLEQSGHTL